MNNASHLWAPISGLTQASISVLGTATTTVAGFFGGRIGGAVFSFPYTVARTPLAGKVKNYQSLEQALSQAKSRPKETL